MRWDVVFAGGCCLLACAATRPAPAAMLDRADAPVLQYVHITFPRAISFAPHAPRLALSGNYGVVDIWNTRAWERLRSFDANGGRLTPGDQVAAGALSPDGKTWALVTYLNQVLLWNVDTGAFEKQLSGPGGPPNDTGPDATVAWTDDGRCLFTNNGMARLWNARSGRLIRKFPGQGAGAISPDGRTVATYDSETVSLYDTESGRRIRTLKDTSGVFQPIAFSPDGRFIATSGEDPGWEPPEWPADAPMTEAYYAHQLKIKIWDRRTGRRLRMLPGFEPSGGPEALAYTADGKRLFLREGDFGFRVINARTGKAQFRSPHDGGSGISPDGRMIVVGDRYDTRILDAATGHRIKTLPAAPLAVLSLAFAPDGRTLASSDWIGERLWDAERARLLRPLPASQPETTDMFFLPNGNLVTEDLNHTWIYNGKTGDRMKRIAAPRMKLSSRAIGPATWQRLLPDGNAFLVATVDDMPNRMEVRDVVTGRTRATIPMGDADLSDIIVSPDGRLVVVSASFPQPGLTVWDLATGEKVASFADMRVPLAFSPDGKSVLGVRSDPNAAPDHATPKSETLGLWSAGTGRLPATVHALLPGPVRGKTSSAFSPDGRILSIGRGADVQLLDGRTMAPLAMLQHGDDAVTALAFSPDGKRLAVGDEGGRIRLWGVAARKLLITMVGFPTRDGSKVSPDWFAATPDGFYAWPDSAAPLIRFRKGDRLYPASAFEKTLRKTDLLGG